MMDLLSTRLEILQSECFLLIENHSSSALSPVQSVIVVGGGGNARALISVIRELRSVEVTGYTDLCDRGSILGAPFLGCDSEVQHLAESVVVSVMYVDSPVSCKLRYTLISRYEALGCRFPVIAANSAFVGDTVVCGKGVLIYRNVVVNDYAELGDHVLLNTGVVIEHNCKIGSGTIVSPGSVICGEVNIGERVFVGAGSVIADGLSICDGAIIGAGSTVTANLTQPGVYVGNPARLAVKAVDP